MSGPVPAVGGQKCPFCTVIVQRLDGGSLLDGMNAHLQVVHEMPRRHRMPADG